jgi:nitrogen fixation protein NifZ
MMETMASRYVWGQQVQAADDLYNDGSYPDQPAGALLVSSGEVGEVVQIGEHTDSGTVVYMVEFPLDKVVGCVEQELVPRQVEGGAL